MAQPACPHCTGHSFEGKSYTPSGSNFPFFFIQCSSCGTVIGVVETHHIGAALARLEEKMALLATDSQATALHRHLQSIGDQLSGLYELLQSREDKDL